MTMHEPVIKMSNIGKKYILHAQNQTEQRSFKEALSENLFNLCRSKKDQHTDNNPQTEVFWALQNICLEIYQGERVGIIGHNGSGKSTLLKLISQITSPSTGQIVLQGRISSLLEVGTGFHPELTGRENIYLNATILGMTRNEIKQKFNQIVAFSGVEKFLDIPVKRYSSGMYVRLAFSVAVHVDPDILIVDEVLSVGDHEFQTKCLHKMQEISQDKKRTILFVSHSFDTIEKLCDRVIVLNKGQIIATSSTSKKSVATILAQSNLT